MKRLAVIILVALAVLGGLVAALLSDVTGRDGLSEVVAYFRFPQPSRGHEMIRLRVMARAPEAQMKSSIEQHRSELRAVLVAATEPGLERPQALRDARRAVLKVLGLENKAKTIVIDVVPDFSTLPRNREIQELLEKAHREQSP